MQKKNLYLILLIMGTAFWGISFPITKMSIGNFSQSAFLFFRFALATLSVALIFYKQLKNIDISAIKAGIGMALPLTFAIHFQTLGLVKHSSSSQCAFVAGMCVVIVPILKVWFYKTKIDIKIWLSAFLSLIGLAIISINKDMSINIADAYVLLGTTGFAFYLIKAEQYATTKSILPSLVPMFATATLIMFLLSLFDNTLNDIPQSKEFWFGIVYCALFTTAFMYSVTNISQKYISAEKVSIIYLFEPVFASIASIFILDESLSWKLLLGGTLIFIAMLISEIKLKHIKS